jgi:cytochrome c oxidase assembly protein subunit 11
MSGVGAQAAGAKKRRTTWLLSLLVLGMFGFGFAMVPLYNLLCQVTGVQSVALRTAGAPDQTVATALDSSRSVTVKFDATVNPNLPWKFTAQTRSMQVHPGGLYEVKFLARNRSNDRVTGQAIPSVVPWQATPFFSKLECFCFNKQMLAGGEETEMPLRFMVSTDLPREINSITLSYSFMKLDDGSDPSQPVSAAATDGGSSEPTIKL